MKKSFISIVKLIISMRNEEEASASNLSKKKSTSTRRNDYSLFRNLLMFHNRKPVVLSRAVGDELNITEFSSSSHPHSSVSIMSEGSGLVHEYCGDRN